MFWAGLQVAMWIVLTGGKFRDGLLEKSLKERFFLVAGLLSGFIKRALAQTCLRAGIGLVPSMFFKKYYWAF